MTNLNTNFKKDDVVLVDWVDITTHTDWVSEKKAFTSLPDTCVCIGFFLSADDKYLRISTFVGTTEDGEKDRDVTIIPIGCVNKIRKIKNV